MPPRLDPRDYTSVPQDAGDLSEEAPKIPPLDSMYPLEVSHSSREFEGDLPAAEESFFGQEPDDIFGVKTYYPHPENESPFDPSSFDASRNDEDDHPSSFPEQRRVGDAQALQELHAPVPTDSSLSSGSSDGKRTRDGSEDNDADFDLRTTKRSKTNTGTPPPARRKKKHISTARPQVYGGDTMNDAAGVYHYDKEGNRKRGSARRFHSWSFGERGNNLLWRLGCWGNHPNLTTRDQIVTDAIAAMKQTPMGQDQELNDSPKWRRTVGNNLTKAIKKSLNEYLEDKDKNVSDAIFRSLAGIKKWDPEGALSMFEDWEPKPEEEQTRPSPEAQDTASTLGTSAATLMPPPAQPYSALGRPPRERYQFPPRNSGLSEYQSRFPFPTTTTTASYAADDSSRPSSSRSRRRRATDEPPRPRPKKRTWAPGEREAQNAALDARAEEYERERRQAEEHARERREARTSRRTRSSRQQPTVSRDGGVEVRTDLPPSVDQSHSGPPVSHADANVQPEDIPIDPILLSMGTTPQNADSEDSHAVRDPLVEVANRFDDYPPLEDNFDIYFGSALPSTEGIGNDPASLDEAAPADAGYEQRVSDWNCSNGAEPEDAAATQDIGDAPSHAAGSDEHHDLDGTRD